MTEEILFTVPPHDSSCISSNYNFFYDFEFTCSFLVYPKGRCKLNSRVNRNKITNVRAYNQSGQKLILEQ